MFKQSGASAIVIILFLMMAGFIVITGMKMISAYTKHAGVKASLESVAKLEGLKRESSREIWMKMRKSLNFNSITFIKKEHFTVVRSKSSMELNIKYEIREPLFSNFDIVAVFDESVPVE